MIMPYFDDGMATEGENIAMQAATVSVDAPLIYHQLFTWSDHTQALAA